MTSLEDGFCGIPSGEALSSPNLAFLELQPYIISSTSKVQTALERILPTPPAFYSQKVRTSKTGILWQPRNRQMRKSVC